MNRIILLLLITITALAGICLLCIGTVPFEKLKPIADLIANDGSAESFQENFLKEITAKINLFSAILLTGSVVMLLLFKKLTHFLSKLKSESIIFFFDSCNKLHQLFYQFSKGERIILLLLFLAGSAIRIIYSQVSIGYDEAFTYSWFISKSLIYSVGNYQYPNNHIFHTILAHFCTNILGNNLWVIRLPALIAGILIIPLTWVFASLWCGKNPALLVTSFIASSGLLIHYSINARGYTIVTVLFLILLIISWSLIKKNCYGRWIWFTLISVIGLYTIPIFLFGWLSALLFIILKRGMSLELIISFLSTTFLTILLYVPVFIISGTEALTNNQYIDSYTFDELFKRLPTYLFNVGPYILNYWYHSLILFLIIALIIFAILKNKTSELSLFIISCFTTILILMLLTTTLPPYRTWLFLVPIILTVAAQGITVIINNRKLILGFAITFCILSLSYAIRENKIINEEANEIKQIAEIIFKEIEENDKIVSNMPVDYPLEYYILRQGLNLNILRFDEQELSKASRVFIINSHSNKNVLKNIKGFLLKFNKIKSWKTGKNIINLYQSKHSVNNYSALSYDIKNRIKPYIF